VLRVTLGKVVVINGIEGVPAAFPGAVIKGVVLVDGLAPSRRLADDEP
jgi:hypothetical protein